MKELIKTIQEVYYDMYDGYLIETTHRKIEFLISNSQYCCESWGYTSTSDNLEEFIGSEFLDMSTVCSDDGMNRFKSKLDLLTYEHVTENAEFITLNTSVGELVFAIYNSHNGYYGHEVNIKIDNKITHNYKL